MNTSPSLSPPGSDLDGLVESIGERIADEVEKVAAGRQSNCEQAARDVLAMVSPTLGSVALADVAAERQRQTEAEGWTPEHDDEHEIGQLAQAAACYALPEDHREITGGYWTYGGRDPELSEWIAPSPRFWPWHADWWKPRDRRRDLVRSAALIVAEIERLDRAALQPQEGGN